MCQSLHKTLKTTGCDVMARGVHQYVQNQQLKQNKEYMASY